MKKEEKIKNSINLMTFSNEETANVPSFVERKLTGKEYLFYGNDNKMPFYLYNLYEKSSLMNSIINTTVSFVLGNEIKTDLDVVNQKGEFIRDLIYDLCLDYLIFGGFAFQIIYNKMGQPNELYWLDFRRCRVNEEMTMVYYGKDFDKKNNPETISYNVWKPGMNRGSAVYYYNGTSRSVYPVPRYSGSLSAIETSIRIDNFHLNAIKNNFNSNFVISMNNGIPDDQTQHKIEREIKEKFCGNENASKFMLVWNDSKDNAVSVEKIPDDNSDKKYEQLFKSTMQSVFTGFSAPQQLFGYAIEGNVFNKSEYQEAFDLYDRLQVQPIQILFKNIFAKIYGTENKIDFVPFALDQDENNEQEEIKNNPENNE